jgi:hypothetical protein
MSSDGPFRYTILVGMTRVPLHARCASVAQIILGSVCTNVHIAAWPRVVPADDDREFFISTWCLHPRFILGEKIIFILEPRVSNHVEGTSEELPGLR